MKERSGTVLWLTGLSGAGKTTLARELRSRLEAGGKPVCLLDGDELREGINADLGFDNRDRCESLRRAAHIAATVADLGVIVLVAMISPYRDDRERARRIIGAERFVEVFVKVPLDTAKERDPKGLYEKAQNGEIDDFTGISDPYEEPDAPDLIVDTAHLSLDEAVGALLRRLEDSPAGG